MAYTVRKVRLPNGQEVIEQEHLHYGTAETQVTYKYILHDYEMSKAGFDLDYWGRIEGITVLD